MNARQQRFVNAYLKDPNATRAAVAAGYSKRTAGAYGHDLLKNPEVSTAIREKMEKIAEKQEISVEWVLNGLKDLALTAKMENVRATAYQSIGKHIGMFKERVELTGADGGPIKARLEIAFAGNSNNKG